MKEKARNKTKIFMTKINHYEYINWEYWKVEEIEYYSNGCGSSRGIFRPPYARQYMNVCNHHDIRYMCWGSIFHKFWADLVLFIEMFLSAFTYLECFGVCNIFRVFLAFMYFIGVWVFGTIIDFLAFMFFWKEPSFQFGKRKKRKDFIS